MSGMPGTFSPPPTSKERLVNDPGIHHGTCVTHVPRCMSGLLTRGGGENVPGIPGACATFNFAYLARGKRPMRTDLNITPSDCREMKRKANVWFPHTIGWPDNGLKL